MLNDRLRATRIFRGYTLQEVCDATDLQVRTYQRYEGGQCEPPLRTLVILAEFYKVPTDFFSVGMNISLLSEYPLMYP